MVITPFYEPLASGIRIFRISDNGNLHPQGDYVNHQKYSAEDKTGSTTRRLPPSLASHHGNKY
jgi:hypothetical protein